jgi:hypothetical protein
MGERALVTRRATPGQCRGPRARRGRPQGVPKGREYRTEPEAREERTGLAGPGVALRWEDAGRQKSQVMGRARSDGGGQVTGDGATEVMALMVIPPESSTLVGGLSPDDVDQQGAEHVKRAALEAFAADQDLVAVGAGDLPAVGAK